ncbi:MAG: (Fe-S)-binding protein [Bacteroidota bacterium]|nr:(Fe-S)-binding protein [Bacteroidota bacterium]
MQYIPQLLFVALCFAAIYFFAKKAGEIKRNILLGREEDLSGNSSQRWKNVLLLALGQKKMFKNPLVAFMHFIIYAGFIIINIEVLEIVLDGIWGTHRLFAAPLGNVYSWLINAFEFLAVSVIIVCVVFLIRRNVIRIKRFTSKDLNGWPKSDANYILITEIILMSLFLTMNACDTSQTFFFSSFFKPAFNGVSEHGLELTERTCWWLHIIGIFAFLNYLPYSKHLHIILAFPNAYYARLQPQGQMNNMQEIQKEVLYAMQPELAPTNAEAQVPPKKFGAKDVFDLSWKNLLDAYSCTECGRCTASCPANITGKVLSPRAIMMKTRDRLEEVGKIINTNGSFTDDQKTLLRDHITEEELRACTTCNACVEACPVSISPLDIILQMRRYLIMEESNAPQEWNSTFSNIENNFAPWKFAPDDRDLWAKEI